MKKIFLIQVIVLSAASFCYAQGQSQVITTGNNTVDPANPYAGDIIIGSNADGGTRHDASMMWWSNGSASRISNSSDVFYYSVWNTTTPNIGLSATLGTSSYFQGGLGIGTTAPQSKLHILDNGSSSNASGQYSGNLLVQGNSGSRTATSGASIEFVIPANIDGSNPWGQARIITVAGNANNGDATGRLILGTRRYFDKGTGAGPWNYGDDLTIDGNGFIGINTSDTKGYNLAVNGKAIATSMTVKLNANWPDYVFKKEYQLPSLTEVKTYIDQNHRLPDMPSEQEVKNYGINLGEIVKIQTKKIEELTLYAIQQQEENEKLKAENRTLKECQQKVNQAQQDQIDQLKRQLTKILTKS